MVCDAFATKITSGPSAWQWELQYQGLLAVMQAIFIPLQFYLLIVDILKKLSKSQNTVFCGRIQLFLARLFPLTEKSGKF